MSAAPPSVDATPAAGALFLSRLTLKRSPEIAPLIHVLRPDDNARAVATDHRLMWSAMPEAVQQRRAERPESGAVFLWRREENGRYFLLGPRPRADSSLFDVESKPFEAKLAPGDRLRFVLRVNATVDRRSGGRAGRRERADIAMDLLKSVASGARAPVREQLAARAARDWLAGQGEKHGFELAGFELKGYRAALVDRGKQKPGRIGVFDLSGVIALREPDLFLPKLQHGFGRAKAFGCGLMLIRRAAGLRGAVAMAGETERRP